MGPSLFDVPDNEWTYRDQVLAATLDILKHSLSGTISERAVIPTSFKLAHRTERIVAVGNYSLNWWGAAGDGSYDKKRGLVFGFGGIGLLIAGGILTTRAVKNFSAKKRAAADSAICWRDIGIGQVHVSDLGFYLSSSSGDLSYNTFQSIQKAEMAGPGMLLFTISTPQGSEEFHLVSDWSELIFGLWAIARNQHHPQWLNRSWFPFEVMRQRALFYNQHLPNLPAGH